MAKIIPVSGYLLIEPQKIEKTTDTVVYKEWGGKEYKDGDKDLLILKFEDIMAIIQ